MNVKPTQIPHVMDFRGSYGRLCVLAAQAMKDGCSREAVRYALAGEGDYIALGPVRRARQDVNLKIQWAATALEVVGVERAAALEMCVIVAREAREAVEAEWGCVLPMVNVQ